MVTKCIVLGCSNTYGMCKRLKFHTFAKDVQYKQLWLVAIGREGTEPKSHWRVCSDHFSSNDYDCRGTLQPGAIPNVSFSKVRRTSKCDADVHNLRPVTSEKLRQTFECDVDVHNLCSKEVSPVLTGEKVRRTSECDVDVHNLCPEVFPVLSCEKVRRTSECDLDVHNLYPELSPVLTYEKLISHNVDLQTRTVGTQTSPQKLGDTARKMKLKKRIKILQRTLTRLRKIL